MRMAYRRSGRVIFLSKRGIIMMMWDQIVMKNSHKVLWEKDTFSGSTRKWSIANLFCSNTLDSFSV